MMNDQQDLLKQMDLMLGRPDLPAKKKDGPWGNLPPRLRQDMDAGPNGRFMPRYEDLLREYYKRLAEHPEFRRRD